ncbi:MAG TPA: OmpA family protein [Bryobacteraceae bacterium]|nr:OmpA family protein [Bryobacteraceae bacterium]
MKTAACFIFIGTLMAQVPNPTNQQSAPPETGQPMPIFRVTVVSRTTKAINYHHRTGTTHIDFRGTELMPAARGEANVQSQMGSTKIDTFLNHMTPANQFGPEYMTYVLWGITPEGRATNLGEVVLEGDHAKLLSTTDLQAFGLIVTAEPYFAVTQPSNVVVAENFLRNDTAGTIEEVDAKYELLERGQYVLDRGRYQPVRVDPKGPLQLAEAQNAVEIARLAGADRYAADTFQKAQLDLQNAEGFLSSNNRKESETDAREAAQMAEDARIITIRKERQEEQDNQRAAAAAREAAAQAAAQQAEAQAKADQQAREQAEQARMQAEELKSEAQTAAEQAAQAKAAADAARQQALAEQAAATAEADRLRQANQQSEAEKAQLRERLKQQFNAILETRETARGLIVNISDVLFDFDRYTLKPGAREKLAKVSGILLAYPGLKIQLEGHTDSVGSDDYNMKLSKERADAVYDYLVSQGVSADGLSSVGLGKSGPVASNDTAEGRQQNRRVEMVVSGEPIGIGGDLRVPQ